MSLLDPQPPPVPADGDIWQDILDTTDAPPEMRALYAGRRAFGIAKHGTPVQVGNRRDARADALQEALDGIAYAECRAQQLSGVGARIWRKIRADFETLARRIHEAP